MHVLYASIIYLSNHVTSLTKLSNRVALAEYSPQIISYYSTGQYKLFKVIYYSEDWNIYWEQAVTASLSSQHMCVSNACNMEFRLLVILGDESIRLRS